MCANECKKIALVYWWCHSRKSFFAWGCYCRCRLKMPSLLLIQNVRLKRRDKVENLTLSFPFKHQDLSQKMRQRLLQNTKSWRMSLRSLHMQNPFFFCGKNVSKSPDTFLFCHKMYGRAESNVMHFRSPSKAAKWIMISFISIHITTHKAGQDKIGTNFSFG